MLLNSNQIKGTANCLQCIKQYLQKDLDILMFWGDLVLIPKFDVVMNLPFSTVAEFGSFIQWEVYKNLRNIIWDFDNIIKSYNKDLAKLFLISLEEIIRFKIKIKKIRKKI